MKTTTFVFPQHYHEACKVHENQLRLIDSSNVDIPDIFYKIYQTQQGQDGAIERFGASVAKYIKGFWCDILEEGLHRRLHGDSDAKEKIKKASEDLFETALPQYVVENIDQYPEFYQVLKLSFERTTA